MTATYDGDRALEVLAGGGAAGEPRGCSGGREEAAARLLEELAALNGKASVTVECTGTPFVLRVSVGDATVGVKYVDGWFFVLGPGPGMRAKVSLTFDPAKRRFEGAELAGPAAGRRDALVELATAIARQIAADRPGASAVGA